MSEKIRIRDVGRDIDIYRREDLFVCTLAVPRSERRKFKALEGILSRPWLMIDTSDEPVSIEKQMSDFSDAEILAELQRRLSHE